MSIAPAELVEDIESAPRSLAERDDSNDGLEVVPCENFVPHAKQLELMRCKARYIAVNAGRRSGKTVGGGNKFVDRIFEDHEALLEKQGGNKWIRPLKLSDETIPTLVYWAVAPTYDLTKFQKREIFQAIGGPSSPLILKYDRSKNLVWLTGGLLIAFKSADRPERLVAEGVKGVWIEEAARIKADTWKDSIRPALTDYQGWAIFTSTPLGKTNWFFKDIWQRTQHTSDPELRDPEFEGLKFYTEHNTAIPELVEEVRKAKRQLPRAMYLRNYRASFDAFEGKIYTSFVDSSTHLRKRIPYGSFVRRIAGVDWGFKHPGVLLEIGIDERGRWWVYNEEYHSGLVVRPPAGASERSSWLYHFKAAKDRGVEVFWADPSMAEYIRALRAEGINIKAADNSVTAGIERVSAMLEPVPDHGPNLLIYNRARNLRSELSSYQWSKGEKPVKENDHAPDALRYAVQSEDTRGGGVKVLAGLDIFRR